MTFSRLEWTGHEMNPFQARFQGEIAFPAVPQGFTLQIAERVRSGLLLPGSRNRANYSVRSSSNDEIHFGADDWWTAINVGLNEVEIRRLDSQRLSYDVRFERWRNYGVGLGLTGALIFVLLIVAGNTLKFAQSLGIQQLMNPGSIAIGAFFCLFWPWILVALHKHWAAKCIERIVRETLSA